MRAPVAVVPPPGPIARGTALALAAVGGAERGVASQRPEQKNLVGIGLRLCAATCFGLMAAMIKLGYRHDIATVELAFYRFAFGLPPLILWIAWSRNYAAWRTQRPLAHVWRALVGLATMLLAFSGLFYLPLAESTTIGFAAPLFAVMLSALVLKEKVGRHRWSAVALGFVGVLIVIRPGASHVPLIGLLLATTAAFGVGVVAITIRQIGRTENTQTTVLWFTLLSMFALALLMPFYGTPHDAEGWGILFVLGTSGGLGQLFLTSSLRYAPVSVVVPFDYIQLLWAVLLGWLLFADRAPVNTWIGAAVIVSSGLYTVHRERKLGRDKVKAEAAI